MSFSILWSVSTGPLFQGFIYSVCLFIYIIIIFSPKRRYILCNKKLYFFFGLKYFWANLNNWAKCCSDLSLKKKNALFWRERSYISFSVKPWPCHRTSSNFILSMFSRKIYSKFYVVFTTYKNAKIIKKKLLERYSVKKYF